MQAELFSHHAGFDDIAHHGHYAVKDQQACAEGRTVGEKGNNPPRDEKSARTNQRKHVAQGDDRREFPEALDPQRPQSHRQLGKGNQHDDAVSFDNFRYAGNKKILDVEHQGADRAGKLPQQKFRDPVVIRRNGERGDDHKNKTDQEERHLSEKARHHSEQRGGQGGCHFLQGIGKQCKKLTD